MDTYFALIIDHSSIFIFLFLFVCTCWVNFARPCYGVSEVVVLNGQLYLSSCFHGSLQLIILFYFFKKKQTKILKSSEMGGTSGE
jgi:hypothetical protein